MTKALREKQKAVHLPLATQTAQSQSTGSRTQVAAASSLPLQDSKGNVPRNSVDGGMRRFPFQRA